MESTDMKKCTQCQITGCPDRKYWNSSWSVHLITIDNGNRIKSKPVCYNCGCSSCQRYIIMMCEVQRCRERRGISTKVDPKPVSRYNDYEDDVTPKKQYEFTVKFFYTCSPQSIKTIKSSIFDTNWDNAHDAVNKMYPNIMSLDLNDM